MQRITLAARLVREGVMFHFGTRFTALELCFRWDRCQLEQLSSNHVSGQASDRWEHVAQHPSHESPGAGYRHFHDVIWMQLDVFGLASGHCFQVNENLLRGVVTRLSDNANAILLRVRQS